MTRNSVKIFHTTGRGNNAGLSVFSLEKYAALGFSKNIALNPNPLQLLPPAGNHREEIGKDMLDIQSRSC
jgi:hypothetical protein